MAISEAVITTIAILSTRIWSANGQCPSLVSRGELPGDCFCRLKNYFTEVELYCEDLGNVSSVPTFADTNLALELVAFRRNTVIRRIQDDAFERLIIRALQLKDLGIRIIADNAFRGLEHTLEELYLEANQLREVPTNALRSLSRLRYLGLDENRIAEIGDDAFRGLASLSLLSLANNRIARTSAGTFEGLRSLSRINLNGNRLRHLSADVFRKMPNLIEMSAYANRIASFDPKAFSALTRLERLDLSRNEIRELAVGIFRQNTELQYLYVSRNNLTRLPDNLFGSSTRLVQVDLSYNRLEEIRSLTFKELSYLRVLRLNDNEIKNFDWTLLNYQRSLKNLYLRNNRISYVTMEAETTLTYLDLGGNELNELPDHWLGEVKVVSLDLSNNRINSVSAMAFRGSHFLDTLRLSYNNISWLIPEVFGDAFALSSLYLNNNNLQASDLHVIQFLPYLTTLDASHNLITDIPRDLFQSNKNIETLDLSFNQLGRLRQEDFGGLDYLQYLYLQANALDMTITHDFFQKATRIQTIDFRNNRIRAVEKYAFYGMDKLMHIDLSYNQLSYLSSRCLYYAKSLRSVNLTGNYLTSISKYYFDGMADLSIFDISNNLVQQIDPRTFDGGHALTNVRIGGNPFDCSCDMERVIEIPFITDGADVHCHLPVSYSGSPAVNFLCTYCSLERFCYATTTTAFPGPFYNTSTEQSFASTELTSGSKLSSKNELSSRSPTSETLTIANNDLLSSSGSLNEFPSTEKEFASELTTNSPKTKNLSPSESVTTPFQPNLPLSTTPSNDKISTTESILTETTSISSEETRSAFEETSSSTNEATLLSSEERTVPLSLEKTTTLSPETTSSSSDKTSPLSEEVHSSSKETTTSFSAKTTSLSPEEKTTFSNETYSSAEETVSSPEETTPLSPEKSRPLHREEITFIMETSPSSALVTQSSTVSSYVHNTSPSTTDELQSNLGTLPSSEQNPRPDATLVSEYTRGSKMPHSTVEFQSSPNMPMPSATPGFTESEVIISLPITEYETRQIIMPSSVLSEMETSLNIMPSFVLPEHQSSYGIIQPTVFTDEQSSYYTETLQSMAEFKSRSQIISTSSGFQVDSSTEITPSFYPRFDGLTSVIVADVGTEFYSSEQSKYGTSSDYISSSVFLDFGNTYEITSSPASTSTEDDLDATPSFILSESESKAESYILATSTEIKSSVYLLTSPYSMASTETESSYGLQPSSFPLKYETSFITTDALTSFTEIQNTFATAQSELIRNSGLFLSDTLASSKFQTSSDDHGFRMYQSSVDIDSFFLSSHIWNDSEVVRGTAEKIPSHVSSSTMSFPTSSLDIVPTPYHDSSIVTEPISYHLPGPTSSHLFPESNWPIDDVYFYTDSSFKDATVSLPLSGNSDSDEFSLLAPSASLLSSSSLLSSLSPILSTPPIIQQTTPTKQSEYPSSSSSLSSLSSLPTTISAPVSPPQSFSSAITASSASSPGRSPRAVYFTTSSPLSTSLFTTNIMPSEMPHSRNTMDFIRSTTDKYTVTTSITRLPNVIVSPSTDVLQSLFTTNYHDDAYTANTLPDYVEQDKTYHEMWNVNWPSTPAERNELSTLSMPTSPSHNGNDITTTLLVPKEDMSTVVLKTEQYHTPYSEGNGLQTEVPELSEDSEDLEPRFLDKATDSSPRGEKRFASSKTKTVSNVFQKLIEQYRESHYMDRSDATAESHEDASTSNPVSLIEMLISSGERTTDDT